MRRCGRVDVRTWEIHWCRRVDVPTCRRGECIGVDVSTFRRADVANVGVFAVRRICMCKCDSGKQKTPITFVSTGTFQSKQKISSLSSKERAGGEVQ